MAGTWSVYSAVTTSEEVSFCLTAWALRVVVSSMATVPPEATDGPRSSGSVPSVV